MGGRTTRGRARPARKSGAARVDRPIFAPAAVGRVTSGRGKTLPTISSRGRTMVISHRERFASVKPTGSAFEVSSHFVNPGLCGIFPWMSDVANRFEKYKFSKLAFRYVPQCDTQAGLVTLAFDFDPIDDAPDTMAQAATYSDHASSSIWHEVTMQVDLAAGDRLPQKNVRAGNIASVDLNMYDVGQLHICTEGAKAETVGYVEVEYTVNLFLHQTSGGVGGKAVATAGLDSTNLVGTDFTIDPHAFLPVVPKSASELIFTQPFEGLAYINVSGTGVSTIADPTTTSTCSIKSLDLITDAVSLLGGIYTIAVRAAPGDILSFRATATTITRVAYYFGRGRYRAFDMP